MVKNKNNKNNNKKTFTRQNAHAIGSRKLSANDCGFICAGVNFVGGYKWHALFYLSCLQQTYYCFKTNKKLLVSWQFSGPYGATKYGSGWRKDAVNQCLEFDQYPNLSEGADRVGGQLRGDKECPFSSVTKSGRVWRKVPVSDARSVGEVQ